MTVEPVLGVAAGVWWYEFSVFLLWVGLIMLVVSSLRAAILSRQDKTGRPWRAAFGLAERRAVGRRRSYL